MLKMTIEGLGGVDPSSFAWAGIWFAWLERKSALARHKCQCGYAPEKRDLSLTEAVKHDIVAPL